MAITIQKSKINGAPVIFGADADTAKGVEVKFGYGTLENVLAKIGTADDGVIYFGYDDAKSTGAIVSRGKLVSSKILDITTTAAVTGEGGKVTQEAKIVISYIDTDKTVKTLEIPVSADGKLKELADKIDALKTLVGTKTDTKETDTVFGAIAKEADRATTKENAISDLLGTAADVSTANTAFGKIAAEADRATKAEGSLDTRVTSIETLITSDKDGTINKVSEVIDWFKGVAEGEGGAKLLADVAANKTAIGTQTVDGTAGTGIYKRIEDLEAKKHTVSDVTATTGKYVSGVKVDDTGALTIKETALTADGVAATAISAGDETVAVEGDKVSTQIANLAKSIKAAAKTADDAIKALDVTDTAVVGQYVSAVSETDGKITVTRADLPTLSVKTGSEQFAAVNNHEVEIKTTALNTVGLTKTEAGKWQAGTADAKSTGLATAADVAAEIVSDEEVIATALNDHENRLKTVEGKEITVSSAKSDVAISVAEVKDGSNVVTTAATNFNVTNGKVTFTIHNGDKAVAETITAYTEDTVKALVELYAKEKARAEAAEAELDVRLSWIEVGNPTE